MRARIIFHGVAILVLLATIAAAQSPQKPATATPAGDSSDCRPSSTPAPELAMRDGQLSAREGSSEPARERRPHQPLAIAANASLGSRYETQTLLASMQADKARGGLMQTVSTSPTYRDNKTAKIKPSDGVLDHASCQ